MTSYSPDDLLTHLHQLNIPQLFTDNEPIEERKKSIKISKQKLKLLKKQIKQEMDVIKSQWDGRNAYEARQERLHLAPYLVVDTLVSQVEVAVNELDIRGSVDWKPDFGTVMVGNFDSGEWHILHELEAIVWEAKGAQKQIEDVKAKIKQNEAVISLLNRKIQQTMRRKKRYALRWFVVATLMLIGGFLFLGGFLFDSDFVVQDSIDGAGIVLIFTAAILYLNAIGILVGSRKPSRSMQLQIHSTREQNAKYEEIFVNLRGSLSELKTLYDDHKRQSLP